MRRKMKNIDPLTAFQRQTLDRISLAGMIVVENSFSGKHYFLPNGETCNRVAVKKLIDEGYLKLDQDGLMNNFPQTFKAHNIEK